MGERRRTVGFVSDKLRGEGLVEGRGGEGRGGSSGGEGGEG